MPIADNADVVLYYAPQSRAFRTLWFLEELGRPYRLAMLDLNKGDHKRPDYLKINPMGKVPTVLDQGTPIAETGAIFTHLADKYSAGTLAPLPDDPRRADYLRWLFFAAGVMEPAFGEKFFKWEVPARRAAWGSFADMERALTDGLGARGPFLLGDRFTAADVFVASNLHWGLIADLFPKDGALAGYVSRCAARPALQRALAMEEGFINARQTEAQNTAG
jgi:glutathione S-transferase